MRTPLATLALLLPLLGACSCPSSFREVPAPRVQSAADVDALTRCQVEHYGTTLLGAADSAATAEALLRRGATPQGKLILHDKEHRGSALWQAERPDVLRALLQADGVNLNQESGPRHETPLCAALRANQALKAQMLLEAGANPNLADGRGVFPLALACEKLNPGLCRLLLSRGARPDIGRSADGATPLLFALRAGASPEESASDKCIIARMLLEAGASPTQADEQGETPLHRAPTALIPTLLAAGADANARDKRGRTPLFYGGSPRRAELLLSAGADLQAKDVAGNTAFDTVENASLKSYLLVKGCRSGHAL